MQTLRWLAKTVVSDVDRLRIARCPARACGLPAEVYDQIDLASTDGPIPHVRTLCLGGHRFFLPLNRLVI